MHPISVRSYLEYQIAAPTDFLLNVAAAQTDHQKVLSEKLTIDPTLAPQACRIGIEQNRFHRLSAQPGPLKIEYTATVQLSPVTEETPQIKQLDYDELPPEVLVYLNPSRYCESDRLANYAMAEFGSMEANFERVNAICNWICDAIEYRAGSTNYLTTACDVLVQRCGVCRDFAHLAIAFCRAVGVPARYVSGYACRLDPPDFHGFFEAYLGDRWYLFDSTRLAPPAGLVRIGVGRDAADTAFATIIGQATLQSMSVEANASREEELLDEEVSQTAVSTA